MKIPENAALRQAQRDVTRLQERTSSSFNVLAKRTKPPSTRPRLRSEEHERAMRQLVTSLGPAQLQQVVPLLLPLLSPAQSVRLSCCRNTDAPGSDLSVRTPPDEPSLSFMGRE